MIENIIRLRFRYTVHCYRFVVDIDNGDNILATSSIGIDSTLASDALEAHRSWCMCEWNTHAYVYRCTHAHVIGMESNSIHTHESESIQWPKCRYIEIAYNTRKNCCFIPNFCIILIKYFTLAKCSAQNQAPIETRDNYIQNLKMYCKCTSNFIETDRNKTHKHYYIFANCIT